MIIRVPLLGSECLAPLGRFDVRTEYNCFLRYSARQLLHFTNGFNSLSYPQALCAIVCGLFILTFAWTKPYTPKPIKTVTSKGQGETLGLRLRIVMTFQTQKLFLIWNILIKCVFGPVSSFAVSTADNLLAQLWLLPRLSTILPNTHTPILIVTCFPTHEPEEQHSLKGAAGCPGSRILEVTAVPFQCVPPMSLPASSFHQMVMQIPFSSSRHHYLMGHKLYFSSHCCYCSDS